jgi:hypothetical protein
MLIFLLHLHVAMQSFAKNMCHFVPTALVFETKMHIYTKPITKNSKYY